MKIKFETKVWAALSIATVIICLVALGAYRSQLRQQQAGKLVEHTYQVIVQLEVLLGTVVDLQTSTRGFILTGEERFLEPYESTRASMGYELTLLGNLVADNPAQLLDVDSLRSLIRAKIDQADDEIVLRRSGGQSEKELKELVELGRVRVLAIRNIVARMSERESTLLAARLGSEQQQGNEQLLFIIIVNLAAIVIVAVSGLSIYREIKRRVRAERDLRENLSFLDSVIENIPNMLFVKDAKELRFVRFNRAGEELLGMSKKEMIGKSDYDFFSKEQADHFTSYDREVLTKGELVDIAEEKIDTRLRGQRTLHTMKIPIVDDSGTRRYLLGISEDITERKKAESMISRFFELSLDLLCIASQDGYFIRLNPSWEKILGYAPNELLQQPFLEFVHPDDRETTITEMSKLATGEEVFGFENRYRCKDGTYRTLVWNSHAVPDSGLIYAVAHDVSERKASQEMLSKLNEELRAHAVGLEATNAELEAFSYSVSHDLRSPLRSIDGFSQALLAECSGDLNETGLDYLHRVRAAAQRMSSLIDDLLKLSRITRSEMQPQETNLTAMAKEIAAELRAQSPDRKATITIHDRMVTMGDARLLRIALENLIGNSWKYSVPTLDAKIEFGSIARGQGPVYYVRDNGVGFDMAHAEKLFQAFERLHRVDEFEGTGIGLATVHRIILRHGGVIWAESEIGIGTTFYFTIGFKEEKGEEHGRGQNHSAGRGQSGRRPFDHARS